MVPGFASAIYTGRAMCVCTKLTAIDPSPTADATRFADPPHRCTAS